MLRPKFQPGQSLYYKPSDFAPLQVTAGGPCKVTELLADDERGFDYRIKLEPEGEERIAKESELTENQKRIRRSP